MTIAKVLDEVFATELTHASRNGPPVGALNLHLIDGGIWLLHGNKEWIERAQYAGLDTALVGEDHVDV